MHRFSPSTATESCTSVEGRESSCISFGLNLLACFFPACRAQQFWNAILGGVFVSGSGQHTINEILHSSQAWESVITLLDNTAGELAHLAEKNESIVFTGCGSALNVAASVAPMFQQATGLDCRAAPAADVFLFPETVFSSRQSYLVVAISRSGETTETIRAARTATDRGYRTLGVTCFAGSALTAICSQSMVLDAASEKSVVTTQSVTSMVLALQMLAAQVGGDTAKWSELHELPIIAQRLNESYKEIGYRIGLRPDLKKFAFVANGPYRGLAQESQLKVKEMILLPSDNYPLMDFRHGPISNVDRRMLVTVLTSDRGLAEETQLVQDVKAHDGVVWVLTEQAQAGLTQHADYLMELRSGLSEWARAILYLPPIQFMAYYRSLLEKQDPDNPRNLTYWVKTTQP